MPRERSRSFTDEREAFTDEREAAMVHCGGSHREGRRRAASTHPLGAAVLTS